MRPAEAGHISLQFTVGFEKDQIGIILFIDNALWKIDNTLR